MYANDPLNTFVIRFWRRSPEERPGWVGQAWHMQSKKSCLFLDLSTLQDFFCSFGVVLTDRDTIIYIEAILSAMDRLEIFVGEMNYEQFEDSLKTKGKVFQAIELISKVTKNIPIIIRNLFPSTPWQVLTEMTLFDKTNLDEVTLQRLWHLARDDIPDIKNKFEEVLYNNYSKFK